MTMSAEGVSGDVVDRPGPTRPADRIFQLDLLRGWAVLGILAVNAMAFAWPVAALMTSGDVFGHAGGDAWGDWVTEVFFQDKFRTLFTLLFGASIFLVGGEREDEGRGKLLRSRLFWLAVFGIVHGAAIWYGDILLHYAVCGLIVLLMRSWSARRLLWIGGGISALWMALAVVAPLVLGGLGPEFAAKMNAGAPQITLEQLNAGVAAYTAGGGAPWIENLKAWGLMLAISLTLIPVTVPLMLLGMGLFKSGFFSGRAPTLLYGLMVIAGAAILAVDGSASAPGRDAATLPIAGLNEAAGGLSLMVSLAYVSMLLLMTRFGLGIITGRLAPVGRMAFTNYLTQSLMMASLFYLPWGPQWMGTMGPAGLWPIVGGIWVLQLIWSPLWLSVFTMGPLEWLWRCLTYGRMVPLRA
ncbi:DUF418 domain-containing protein [Brevundimonas sp. R86498]|uniref:DUF418 domain-containing protein n=1 Tax=Brevundimonas sp. R86498 TaxID=3093845 RepID=UPI0037C7783E